MSSVSIFQIDNLFQTNDTLTMESYVNEASQTLFHREGKINIFEIPESFQIVTKYNVLLITQGDELIWTHSFYHTK